MGGLVGAGVRRRFDWRTQLTSDDVPPDMPIPRPSRHGLELGVVDDRLAVFGDPTRLAPYWEYIRNLPFDAAAQVWRPRTLASVDAIPLIVDPVARWRFSEFEDVVSLTTPSGHQVSMRRDGAVTPLAHQLEIVDRVLDGQPALCIADDPGLGKTTSVVLTLSAIAPERILVIAPKQLVVPVWWRTLTRLGTSHLTSEITTSISVGGVVPNAPVVITHPEALKPKAHELAKQSWDVVVIDEAHIIGNVATQLTQAVLGTDGSPGIIDSARCRLLLTGTPARNAVEELWPLLRIVDPDGLGSDRTSFITEFADATPLARQELAQRLSPILVRHRVEDTLDLPPNEIRSLILPTTPEITALVLEEQAALLRFGTGTPVRRLARPRDVPPRSRLSRVRAELAAAKVPHVLSLIDHFGDDGEPVVVFAHHVEPLRQMADALGDRAALFIGATPDHDRLAIVDRFQRGELDVLLCSFGAAATGLTLTRARHLIALELPWVPATFVQATRRIARIGQDRPTTTFVCAWDGSVDAVVAGVLQRKHVVLTSIIDDRPVSRDELPLDEGMVLADLIRTT